MSNHARSYDASRAALYRPAAGVTFFAQGRPVSEASLAAEMARLSYAPFESPAGQREVALVLGRVGFSGLTPFDHAATGAQAILATDPVADLAVLAFRGTEGTSWPDLKADLMCWPQAWPSGGTVHSGFAAAFNAIWPAIAPALAAWRGRVVFTGHSLGASMALLACTQRRPDALYTFGCPRVGDQAFVDTLAGVNSHRFIDCADVVCRVPPARWGYRHLGEARYFDRHGRERAGLGEAGEFLDRVLGGISYAVRYGWRPGTVWLRRLSDHAPVNYVTAVGDLGPTSG